MIESLRPPPLRRPVERAELRLEEIGTTEQQPRAAHAEEGVGLLRQSEMGDLLVAPDVESAHDERPVAERVEHGGIDLGLLVLRRAQAPLEEQELGAHQADAFGAEIEGKGDLIRRVDVGGDLDPMAVGRDGGGGALRALPGPDCGVRRDALARGGKRICVRLESQPGA